MGSSETMAMTTSRKRPVRGASSRGPKPKMTKEERRKKYTDIAKKRREKQNGERRRMGNKSSVCYNCRQPGHNASECPNLARGSENAICTPVAPGTTLCYKCGSTEHALHQCPKRHRGNRSDLPFATCFICNEKGHLASACSQNKTGIYVNGGSCRVCGSLQHLATDCPEKKRKKKNAAENSNKEEDELKELLQVEDEPSWTVSKTKKGNQDKTKAKSEEPKKKKKRVVNF